jgi:hypothetical protein
MGMRDLTEYLVEAGIDEAENFSFATPMGISVDGHRIVGFNDALEGWIVDINQHLTGFFNPPKELTVAENGYGNVVLNWVAAANDAGNTLTGYNIYRDGTKVNTAIINATTLTDTSVPNGNYIYKVTAVWNGNEESISTNEVSINIGKVSLPFLEDFHTSSFNDNYWNISPESEPRWILSDYAGINPPCAMYFSPTRTHYEEYLLSPYIDATNATALKLSFNIVIANLWEGTSNETFIVEISDGTTWHKVAEYNVVSGNQQPFAYKEIDISTNAAGKEFKIRFVGSGDNGGTVLIWSIDNINVFTPDDALILSAPLVVTAHKSDDGTVHVNWADPGEVAKLSYLENTNCYDPIGNDGVPFIAGVKFDAKDVAGYDGYKLVSIDAYPAHSEGEPATYKLAVFKGSERIVDQAIPTYTVNEWNTFTLATPITISSNWDAPLYFGIEVVTHNAADLPVGVCKRPGYWDEEAFEWIYLLGGRCDLFSEDGGMTWKSLEVEGIYNAIGVTVNLEGKDGAKPKERLLGYKVLREGENLLGQDWIGNDYLTHLHNYTDLFPLDDENACYQVVAFYDTQQESDEAEYCMGSDAIKNIKMSGSGVSLYPNPFTNEINISNPDAVKSVQITSMTGQKVKEVSFDCKTISTGELSSGIYFVIIESITGDKTVHKMVKK